MPTAEELDGASLPELRSYLDHDSPVVRADAVCALGDRLRAREVRRLEPDVLNEMAALLTDEVPMVQFEAAVALAEAQDKRASEVLLQSIRYRHFRLDAIRALGALGDNSAVEPLRQLMGRWLLPWADKLQAAAALCALGDEHGATYLEEKLASRRLPERAAAMHFIGEARHPRALDLLSDRLADQNDPMRDVAARSLGFLGDDRARGALTRALENADEELTEDIHQSLAALSSPAKPSA